MAKGERHARFEDENEKTIPLIRETNKTKPCNPSLKVARKEDCLRFVRELDRRDYQLHSLSLLPIEGPRQLCYWRYLPKEKLYGGKYT